jgi:hypothetical protein
MRFSSWFCAWGRSSRAFGQTPSWIHGGWRQGRRSPPVSSSFVPCPSAAPTLRKPNPQPSLPQDNGTDLWSLESRRIRASCSRQGSGAFSTAPGTGATKVSTPNASIFHCKRATSSWSPPAIE